MGNILLSHNNRLLSGSNKRILSKYIQIKDHTFFSGDGFTGSPYKVMLQTDNKIIVSGGFTQYSGVTYNGIIRLNSNGGIDDTFVIGSGIGGTYPSAYALEIQSDGKILVGGEFTSYSGTTRNRIIRLNSNGSIDSGFTIDSGFSGGSFPIVEEIKLQTDNKILVGGEFTSYSGTTRNRFVRLNTDGSLDSGFTIGTGFDGTVFSIGLQSTGKILVGGTFSTYSGYTCYGLARLNTNGTFDTSFYTGSTYGALDMVVQNDDKIVVIYNNYYIKRLNSDGSIDSSFNSGYSFDGTAWNIVKQNDDKYIISGFLSYYDVTPINNIARLNNDGTYDSTFNVGSGFDGQTTGMSIQSDNKIIILGAYNHYNGNSSGGIIRLYSDGDVD
jgi:uncharacterized delta-60 repeat protein